MHTFFYGWRRKAGVVTLLMSCGLLGLWMRSFVSSDQICLCPVSIISIRGKISAIWSAQTISSDAPVLTTDRTSLVGNFQPDAYGNCPVWWDTQQAGERWDFAGYHFAHGTSTEESPSFEIGFPNLSIVIPLTLLSAYLILWRPRQQPSPIKQASTEAPIDNDDESHA